MLYYVLVVEPDLPHPKILFSRVWNVCWPIVLQTHGIGLRVVFSHGMFSPIKESIVTQLCMEL